EYGMLVVGWSADYDVALAEAWKSASSRRYPVYWASFHGNLSEAARTLINQRRAIVIETAGSDEFLADLRERIVRLDERAIRRAKPTALRTYVYAPDQQTAPQGWSTLPLLQLRAVGVLGPAT